MVHDFTTPENYKYIVYQKEPAFYRSPSLEQRFSTDGLRPANGLWLIFNGSWKVFRNT